MMPFDFAFDEQWLADDEISAEAFEAKLKEKEIDYTTATIELLGVEGTYEEGIFPAFMDWSGGIYNTYIVSAKQLQKAGLQVDTPKDGTVIYHSSEMSFLAKDMKIPFEIYITSSVPESIYTAVKLGEGNVINNTWGPQFVVNDADFEKYKKTMVPESIENMSPEWIIKSIRIFNITDKSQLALASDIRTQHWDEGSWSYGADYYSMYERSIQSNGLLIFIAGFLGLVFLISTGSILYFKQMTEAEQEKKSYATLRQLGFTIQDIMRGIIRKQAFVFGLPLLIGLLHSVFAIKAASFLFMSDITVPASIAMGVYALIYLIFAFLTVGYYRKTVKSAL